MWFKDAILYQILVDRFNGFNPEGEWNKPVFLGGNLNGVTEKLEYLSELGINTIWLSPICKSNEYHGYHITDFYSVDPHFGTDKDLKNLIENAHARNIRVILDFVPNHCSYKHPFFRDALKSRKSRYRNWFYINGLTGNYQSFLHFKVLPKLRLSNTETANHIIGSAKHWLSFGFDGFRLDHAVGPSHAFWKKFKNEVKAANREAVLIGEAWLEGVSFKYLRTLNIRNKYWRWLTDLNPEDIELEYKGEFDGVLDFYFRHRIIEFIAWKENPEKFTGKLKDDLMLHYRKFPDNYFLPSFVDNHDMSRFIFETGQNKERLKAAMELQFTLPQPPILYYGTETALTHELPVLWDVPFSDTQARRPMPWESIDFEMIDFTKSLIRMRKSGKKS